MLLPLLRAPAGGRPAAGALALSPAAARRSGCPAVLVAANTLAAPVVMHSLFAVMAMPPVILSLVVTVQAATPRLSRRQVAHLAGPDGLDDPGHRPAHRSQDADARLVQGLEGSVAHGLAGHDVDMMGLQQGKVVAGAGMMVTVGVGHHLDLIAVQINHGEERCAAEVIVRLRFVSLVIYCRYAESHDEFLDG
jgi:hypothetical protein